MPRYIDADAFKDYIMDGIADHEDIPPSQFSIVEAAAKGFLLDIDEQPTISPDEVRGVGEWEDAKQHGLCRCSVCKDCYIEKDYITQAKWRFCPSCGARMKGAESEHTMDEFMYGQEMGNPVDGSL